MNIINSKMEIAFLLPVYNCQFSIEKTLRSIFKQNYKNFKIYIINNGSTDNTDSIIKQYALSDKRVKIYNLDKPNLTEALCFGINNIEEELIMRIDSGDTSDFERTSKTLDFMKENPDCAISYTDWYSQCDNKISLKKLPKEINRNDLIFKNKIAHSTICIRKSILKKYNFNYCGFGNKFLYFGPSQDLLLFSIAKFIFNLKIAKVPDTKTKITLDIKDSISHSRKREQRIIATKLLLINNLKYLKYPINKSKRIASLVILFLNFIRLLRYEKSKFSILMLTNFLKRENLDDNYIYQKIIHLK